MARKFRFLPFLGVVRRRPVILILSIVAIAAMYPCFFSVVSFANAITPQEAIQTNKPLPAGWSAGVMNHGEYYQWWTIRDKPVLFYASAAGLVTSLGWLWCVALWAWIRYRKPRVDARQTQEGEEEEGVGTR